MKYFVTIFVNFFLVSVAFSQEHIIICKFSDTNRISELGDKFVKKIDFNNRTLSTVSGGFSYFDKILLFGRNEIILQNRIFDTFSTYNIVKGVWTIYSNQEVSKYECKKDKAPLW